MPPKEDPEIAKLTKELEALVEKVKVRIKCTLAGVILKTAFSAWDQSFV